MQHFISRFQNFYHVFTRSTIYQYAKMESELESPIIKKNSDKALIYTTKSQPATVGILSQLVKEPRQRRGSSVIIEKKEG